MALDMVVVPQQDVRTPVRALSSSRTTFEMTKPIADHVDGSEMTLQFITTIAPTGNLKYVKEEREQQGHTSTTTLTSKGGTPLQDLCTPVRGRATQLRH
jgi:hypothetical protein